MPPSFRPRAFGGAARGLPIQAMAVPQWAMPQLGSVCVASANPLTAGSSAKECSSATARLNWACAAGLHDVLKSTVPSFSDWAEAPVAALIMRTKDANAANRDTGVITDLLMRVKEADQTWVKLEPGNI